MINLISRQREGEHCPQIENEPKNLKYKKKIKFDVFTEIYEFDTKKELLVLLELTCNDNQEVVYTDYNDLNTYHIIDKNAYESGLENILKNEQIFEMFLNFIDESGGLPVELKAFLAKFGDYSAIMPEDV